MKKKIILFSAAVLIVVITAQPASAKIWRVNNRSNYNGTTLWGDNFGGTAAYPVFKQISQVVPVAFSGDTIYVEPSQIIYDNAVIDRKLIIIGSGYFLSRNPHVSTITDSSSILGINFNAGSEGSQVIGMSQIDQNSYFYIQVNNITVKRCNLYHSIIITSNLNDVYILQNFFSSRDQTQAIAYDNGNGFVYPTNLIFDNNICQKNLSWGGSILQCNNNTFDGPAGGLALSFTTSEFKNNILKSLNTTTNINNGSNLNVSYNIGTSATQFGTANNNIVAGAINTIFVTSSSSSDGIYQVAGNSVAANSGSDGTDRGAFGGIAVFDRYTLSGLAAIPVIYSVATPGATSGNLQVTIQARTIK